VPNRMLPSLTTAKAVPRNVDVLVVGMSGGGVREVPEPIDRAFNKRFGISVAEMATSLGAKSSPDTERTLPAAGDGPRIVVVGLDSDQPGAENLRRAAGAGVRHAASLDDSGGLTVAVSLGAAGLDQLAAVAEGALLGSYRYQPISSAPPNGKTFSMPIREAFPSQEWRHDETHTWNPTVDFDSVPPGDYRLCFVLTDERTQRHVKLPIQGDRGDAVYEIGTIRVALWFILVASPNGHEVVVS